MKSKKCLYIIQMTTSSLIWLFIHKCVVFHCCNKTKACYFTETVSHSFGGILVWLFISQQRENLWSRSCFFERLYITARYRTKLNKSRGNGMGKYSGCSSHCNSLPKEFPLADPKESQAKEKERLHAIAPLIFSCCLQMVPFAMLDTS